MIPNKPVYSNSLCFFRDKSNAVFLSGVFPYQISSDWYEKKLKNLVDPSGALNEKKNSSTETLHRWYKICNSASALYNQLRSFMKESKT